MKQNYAVTTQKLIVYLNFSLKWAEKVLERGSFVWKYKFETDCSVLSQNF